MYKLSLLALAFMLIGAGCLSGQTTPEPDSTPLPDVEQPAKSIDAGDEAEDSIVDNNEAEDSSDGVAGFKMVDDPKPATTFNKDDILVASRPNGFGGMIKLEESQTLKLDLDNDGSLEYALVYTKSGYLGPVDNTFSKQFVVVFKWNGAEWTPIFQDSLDGSGGVGERGWFNQYEVTRINGGNHVLYVEKANNDGVIEEYHFGQLPDGSFGKI